MQRHEYTGPVALRAMQNLTGRLFPDSGYRHIGDLAWAWCLALDRADDNPTAVWTDGGKAAPAALPPRLRAAATRSGPCRLPRGTTGVRRGRRAAGRRLLPGRRRVPRPQAALRVPGLHGLHPNAHLCLTGTTRGRAGGRTGKQAGRQPDTGRVRARLGQPTDRRGAAPKSRGPYPTENLQASCGAPCQLAWHSRPQFARQLSQYLHRTCREVPFLQASCRQLRRSRPRW